MQFLVSIPQTPATVQRIESVLKVEDSNANPAPTWRDRDSSDDEVCEGGVRNAEDRASTPPSEVVDALEHDLPEVLTGIPTRTLMTLVPFNQSLVGVRRRN